MISVSELIDDPDFSKEFVIQRTTGTFVGGRFVTSTQPVPGFGSIQPHDEKEIVQLPEGDTLKGSLDIFTRDPLNTTILAQNDWEPDRLSDEIEWNGYRYKVFNCLPWGDFGYFKSLALRKFGA